jgi:enoyl-CoA hydratase/carnithine racemase
MADSNLRVERDGPLAFVTICRSQRRNAITNQMMADLERIAREFADDEQTRAIVVRAEGSDFSVGADLSQPRFSGEDPPSMLMRRRGAELGAQLMRSLQEIHQPTICALQGVATGAGACIASACDFRIADETARVGYGEVKVGINLMWHAVAPCVRLVGPSRAKRLIMTGRLFDAATLERWGFVDEVVPVGELDHRARAWAQEYVDLPPIAVQMIKRTINRYCGALDQAILHADADQWMLASQTNDFREAISAFFEKRPPAFSGD